jgi:hypothetical protein
MTFSRDRSACAIPYAMSGGKGHMVVGWPAGGRGDWAMLSGSPRGRRLNIYRED